MISGSLIMTMTLWITNQTIPWVTALAKSTGALSGDGLAAAMDQGGSPITYIFVELFQRDNFAGLLVIGCIYIVCLAVSVQYSRAEKARSEDDTL